MVNVLNTQTHCSRSASEVPPPPAHVGFILTPWQVSRLLLILSSVFLHDGLEARGSREGTGGPTQTTSPLLSVRSPLFSPHHPYLVLSSPSCSRALCLGSDSLNPLEALEEVFQLHLPKISSHLSSSSYSVSV